MMSPQVKSRQRVAEHAEVFTAEREVKAMCDLVEDECLRIDSRFLEPACGDGNFLAEILQRKLAVVARKYKRNNVDYEKNALLALGSLYGVELLADNAECCRQRLFAIWDDVYTKVINTKEQRDAVRDSARYILAKNIICGNAQTLHLVDDAGQDTHSPIIFSQWAFVTGPMMKREDYTFEQLLTECHDEASQPKKHQGTFDFADDDEDASMHEGEGQLIKIYPPIQYWRLREYG